MRFFRKLKTLVKLKTEEFPHYEKCPPVDGRVPKLSKVSRLLGPKPRTYMGQFPILAAVDLSPVQPQSCSQQDLSRTTVLPQSPLVSLTRRGIPRIIPSFHRT
ncbi:hypothetical protein GBA52_028752 [Prunus armeniaca]|nr:hypothetical protein GBA52_028752 [Prunus armeniaca]